MNLYNFHDFKIIYLKNSRFLIFHQILREKISGVKRLVIKIINAIPFNYRFATTSSDIKCTFISHMMYIKISRVCSYFAINMIKVVQQLEKEKDSSTNCISITLNLKCRVDTENVPDLITLFNLQNCNQKHFLNIL
jgi:hypothetical protein